ncbi:serine/threonine-protein kinase [Actinomadura roseirufa]|uniref:serine/threonine-protein kinase n=1 Tax=Actinomadura roseirufa TaxID=2094049 RepID=UPI001A955CD8|nr:serine/threonine-protein kinase [Actinomadura roseirufa]
MSDGEDKGEREGRLLSGRYRLLSVVGRGGMGTVWRAHDETLDREVAVKEVLLHVSLSDEERENRHRRTLREARASARLNHPGVVTVHDVVDEDGRPWIVMELVRARSLQDVIDEDGPLPPGRAAVIGRQIAGALRAAHAIGILHRDVKPANVLVTEDDRAVLTDFGIAQVAGDATLTRTGLIMGSPAYMSPERVAGDPAIPASDLWALGATLYAACEGKAPHHRSDAMAVLAAVMTLEPPPPRNAGPLAPVLAGLLERDPVRRTGADRAEEALAAVAAGHAADLAAAQIAAHGGTAALAGESTWAATSGRPVWEGAHDWGAGSTAPPTPFGEIPFPAPDTTTQHPGAARKKGRTIWPALTALVVAVAVLVPAGIVLWPESGSGARKPTGPSGVLPSPGASGSPGSGPVTDSGTTSGPRRSPARRPMPSGLAGADGPGYTIGVPHGWRKSVQKNSVVWIDPATSAYVQVDRTPWQGDPYDHWIQWEREALADGKLQNFQKISLERSAVGSLPAADIQFTWSRGGGTRAVDRGVIVNGRAYAVVVAVPAARWAEYAGLVKNVLDTFRPSGVG